MKKLQPIAAILFACCAGLSLSLAQSGDDPSPHTPPPKVEKEEKAPSANTEKRLALLEAQLREEQARHEETRQRLEETIRYLNDQADRASTVMVELDRSEAEGFTAGINFRSREILLGGFRGYWGEARSGLPQATEKPKKTAQRR